MDDPEVPPAPDGYGSPVRITYPTGLLLLGSLALGFLVAGIFGLLLWTVHGPGIFTDIFDLGVPEITDVGIELGRIAIPFTIALIITVIVHEYIHGAVFRLKGYDVQYGSMATRGVFFTAALGQYQQREDLLLVALAPLLFITFAAIPFLFVPRPVVAITAYIVLILNTSGSIGDIYISWRLWRCRPGTLLYDADLEHMFAYEPEP